MNDFTERLQRILHGRYVIERELGRGGMSTVYLAQDVRHGRRVAIKAFEADAASGTAAERFRQEIRIVSSLTHPHIVPLFDSAAEDGVAWFAMPVAEGESLRDRLTRERQLPVADAVGITLEVADALDYAHQHGVVHRDIKPENILLQGEHSLVTDFGVARSYATGSEPRLTASGVGVGTPAYMSPEQLGGDMAVDGRADQYALAMVLYEMLAGDHPFAASTPQASLSRKARGELISVGASRPAVAPGLDAVLRRALSPTPADRYPGMRAFADAVRSVATLTDFTPTRARNRTIAAVAATVVVLIAAAVYFRPHVGARRLEPSLVAVFPFRVTTADEDDWAEGLPDFLATALDGTPGVRVADPWSLWRPLRKTREAVAESPPPQEAAKLARARGAGRFVLGQVRRDGHQLAVIVRVYVTATPDSVEQTLSESARDDSLTSLASRVAVAMMGLLGAQPSGTRHPNPERYTTRSADAMKAYLAARAALRRGMIDSADRAIDRALALDSAFALALSEAAEIKTWVQFSRGQGYAGLRELVARGLQFADSLSERNRLRLQLQEALIETEGPRAAELARRLVELDSSDFEAWNALSYVRMVHGWQYGATAADALAATDRALQLDSTNALALSRRLWLAAQSADIADMRKQLARLRASDHVSGVLKGFELGLELLLATDRTEDSLLAAVRAGGPAVWTSTYRVVRATRPDRAWRLARSLADHADAGAPARLAQNLMAGLALASGRQDTLAVMLDAPAFAANPVDRHRFDEGLVASALIGVSSEVVRTRALENLTRYAPIDSAMVLFGTRDVWQAGWLIAAYHASYGDTAIAKRWYAVIRGFPTAGAHPVNYPQSLQEDLGARMAARHGDTRGALAHASRALQLWTVHTENTFEFTPEPQIRFLTARLLRAEHRPDSAAKIFRSLTPPVTWLATLTPLAWTELGEIAADARNCAQAAAFFEAALSLWDSASRAAGPARERALSGRRRCGAGTR